MSLRALLAAVRERWVIIVACALVGTVVGLALAIALPDRYEARATLYVSTQSDNTTQAYQGGLLSEQRVQSYVELLGSTRVAAQVGQILATPESPEDIAGQITASTQPDTVLLTVTAVDGDPARATALANTTAQVFSALVYQIEQPIGRTGPPSVGVNVVQPAVAPTDPFAPNRPGYVLGGLALGLLVGLAAAGVRSVLDNSIKSAAELEQVAGAPVVGTIVAQREIAEQGVVTAAESNAQSQEMFKRLRTNIQFLNVDVAQKVLLFTSSVPAEGKTTTCTNTAMALAESGVRVCLVEGDLRRPKASALLGVERQVGLSTYLAGKLTLDEAIQPVPQNRRLDVLASGPLPANPSELLGSERMAALISELRSRYDMVLVDGAPLLPVADSTALASTCDGVVLVCRYGETGRGDVRAAAQTLERIGAPLLGAVLTMTPRGRGRSGYYGGYGYDAYTADGVEPEGGDALVTLQPAVRRAGEREAAAPVAPAVRGGGSGSAGKPSAGKDARNGGTPEKAPAKASGKPTTGPGERVPSPRPAPAAAPNGEDIDPLSASTGGRDGSADRSGRR